MWYTRKKGILYSNYKMFSIIKSDMWRQNKKSNKDFMFGYSIGGDKNCNSFYATVDGIRLWEFVLSDDPADSKGCLSRKYHIEDKNLDAGGSYVYLCKV